jgi:SAM-dependent methyltransferase
VAVNEDVTGLLELIACPLCRSRVVSAFAGLACTGCGRRFALDGRVPDMVVGEGGHDSLSILARAQYAVLGDPRVYDLQQRVGGADRIFDRVEETLAGVDGKTLLDIGAGTGVVATLLPPESRYVWVDNDRLKLRGLLSRGLDCLAVLGDGAAVPFADRAADWTVMVDVSHHLPDDALRTCLGEVARVTRERFVFADAVRGDRLRSNLMWQLDLGRFPRREDALLEALRESFEIESVLRFRVNHDHLLCVCGPRAGVGSQDR